MSNRINRKQTNDKWSCSVCTYNNPAHLEVCEICGKGKRPAIDIGNVWTCDELIRWITYLGVISNEQTKKNPNNIKKTNINIFGYDDDTYTSLDPTMLVHNSCMKSTTLLESIINVFWDPYNEHGNTNDISDDNNDKSHDPRLNFEKKFRSTIVGWLKHWMIHYWSEDFTYCKELPNDGKDHENIKDRKAALDRLNAFIDELIAKDGNTGKDGNTSYTIANAPYLNELGKCLATTRSMLMKEHEVLKDVKYDRWIWDIKDFTWKQEKIIWLGFYSNDENKLNNYNGNSKFKKKTKKIYFGKIKKSKCYFAELPKVMIKHILSFVKGRIYFESTNIFLIKMKFIRGIKTLNYQFLNQILEPDWSLIDISKFNIDIKGSSNNIDIDIDIVDIAQQITLITYRIFMQILPKEMINKQWFNKDKIDLILYCSNISKMIQLFQELYAFIQIKIIAEKTFKDRIKSMKEALRLCEELKKLGNYHALYAIFSGLEANTIHRLKDAWNKVYEKKKYDELKYELLSLMDTQHNQRNMRNATRKRLENLNVNEGLIPYIGMYLKDLVFIEDGNRNMIDIFGNRNLRSINFRKWYRIHDRINNVSGIIQSNIDKQAYFDIEPNYGLQKALLLELDLSKTMSEEDLWNLSTEVKKNDKNENTKSSNKLKFLPFVQN